MGNTSSNDNPYAYLYQKVHRENPAEELNKIVEATNGSVKGGLEGGFAGSFTGGADKLQSYGDSVYSKAKEKLIRDIAGDVFKVLQIEGSQFARTAPLSKIVAVLQKKIPNPKVKGFAADFNNSKGGQKKLCVAFAEAINLHYGSNIVPTDQSEQQMCTKIFEVMSTLMSGLHSEFMSVAGDSLRIMKNIHEVSRLLDASYKKQVEFIQASNDSSMKEMSADVSNLYNTLRAELDRQIAMLSNELNVSVGPTAKSLITLLEENNEFESLVRDIKAAVGTTAFGDKLAYLLSGVNNVAHSAEKVEKALKKLGMTVQEFKSAKNPSDLHAKVYKHITSGKPTGKQLEEMLSAATVIYKYDYSHPDIVAYISKHGKGEISGGCCGQCGMSGGCECTGGADEDGEIFGGDDEDDEDSKLPTYWNKKTLSKQIKQKDKFRKLLLQDFKKVLQNHYQSIVTAAHKISSEIGSSIPVTDDLEVFVAYFSTLETLDKTNLHVALSGYSKDVESKEVRAKFMDKYSMVSQSLEPLLKGPSGQHFKAIQNAIDSMIKSIDDFADKIIGAITEIHVDNPTDIRRALKETTNKMFGAGESDNNTSSFVAFERVKNEMKYFLSIANVKTNLSKISDSISEYGEDYEQLIGEQSARIIDNIKKSYDQLIEAVEVDKLTTDLLNAGTEATKLRASFKSYFADLEAKVAAGGLMARPAADAKIAECKNSAKALAVLFKTQLNAKINLVNVAQAVELYLRAFTDGMVKHPDSIKSIVPLLDQVEIVAKWFNDRSGDNLAMLFDSFPEKVDVDGATTYVQKADEVKPVNADSNGFTLKHSFANTEYYDYLTKRRIDDNVYPGNPFLGRTLTSGHATKEMSGLLDLADRSSKGMRALENILSAFQSIGNKFGDLNVQNKTFMTPAQILNALFAYVKASSLTSGFLPSITSVSGNVAGLVTSHQIKMENGTMEDIPNNNPEQHRNIGLLDTNAASVDIGKKADAVPAALLREYGLLSGVAADDTKSADVALVVKKHTAVAMAGLPAPIDFFTYHDPLTPKLRVDHAGWSDRFGDTDGLFQMVIKSIVCKIFTVVDAYRMFNRPFVSNNTNDIYTTGSMNPLRTILGGAERSFVKTESGAVALYYRLLLLAEWYREKFGFNSSRNTNGQIWILSIAPSIDGTFSGLVNTLFDKTSYVQQGNYTESQYQKIITECNNIYKTYKSRYPKATIRNILLGFVEEMNRCIGYMRQSDIVNYLNQQRKFYDDGTDLESKDSFINYDILNAEDTFNSAVKAPSDRFVKGTDYKLKSRPERTQVDDLQIQFLEKRKEIDAEFLEAIRTTGGAYDFSTSLKNYTREYDNANSELEKYQIVLRMLQGSNTLINDSADKYIMLHESVVLPLRVLFHVWQVLFNFNCLVHGTSDENFIKYNSERKASKPGVADAITNANELGTTFLAYLNDAYPDAKGRAASCLKFMSLYRVLGGKGTCATFINTACAYTTAAPGTNSPADYSKIAGLVLRSLVDLVSNPNKYVEMNMNSSRTINLSFAPLEELSRKLLFEVKSNLQKLKINFKNPESLNKYEDLSQFGSVRWLEENLVNVLFEDKYRCGLNQLHQHLKSTLDACANPAKASALYGEIALMTHYSVVDDVDAVGGAPGVARPANTCLPYLDVLNNLTTFPYNVISYKKEADLMQDNEKKALQEIKSESKLTDFNDANTVLQAPVIKFLGGANVMNTWNFAQQEKSLLCAFNKIVHNYLSYNFDETTQKIYTPLFESFMNSVGSLEVLQNKGFPNVLKIASQLRVSANVLVSDQYIGLFRPESVLYASSALAMKSLVHNMDLRLKKKKNQFENITEVPEYLKEKMRVNLPYFSGLFSQISDRAVLLKNILNTLNLKDNLGVPAGTITAAFAGEITDVCEKTTVVPTTKEQTLTYLNTLLTRLSEESLSLKKCCDSVYKELQDVVPYFLDLGKDFIMDYKQRNGVLPLMPTSDLLLPLLRVSSKDFLPDYSELLLPSRINGTKPYRYNFACRLLMTKSEIEPQLEHLPGAKDIYNSYMKISSKNNPISAQEYSDSIKNSVKLIRFLTNGAIYSQMFARPLGLVYADTVGTLAQDRHGAFTYCQDVLHQQLVGVANNNKKLYEDLKATTEANIGLNTGNNKKLFASIITLQNTQKFNEVLDITENNNMEQNKSNFAAATNVQVTSASAFDRKAMRIVNILDMNIVPLNVHAFMKEVPFTNLLNYSYTFDRMMHDFIVPSFMRGKLSDKTATVIDKDNILFKHFDVAGNTREMLVKLITLPYTNLNFAGSALVPPTSHGPKEYYALVASLFNGNDDMRLGRPRYLSDQLWHKVLLTSSVQVANDQKVNSAGVMYGNTYRLESGPMGYEAIRSSLRIGSELDMSQNLSLVDSAGTSTKVTALAINKLFNPTSDSTSSLSKDAAFNMVPQLTTQALTFLPPGAPVQMPLNIFLTNIDDTKKSVARRTDGAVIATELDKFKSFTEMIYNFCKDSGVLNLFNKIYDAEAKGELDITNAPTVAILDKLRDIINNTDDTKEEFKKFTNMFNTNPITIIRDLINTEPNIVTAITATTDVIEDVAVNNVRKILLTYFDVRLPEFKAGVTDVTKINGNLIRYYAWINNEQTRDSGAVGNPAGLDEAKDAALKLSLLEEFVGSAELTSVIAKNLERFVLGNAVRLQCTELLSVGILCHLIKNTKVTPDIKYVMFTHVLCELFGKEVSTLITSDNMYQNQLIALTNFAKTPRVGKVTQLEWAAHLYRLCRAFALPMLSTYIIENDFDIVKKSQIDPAKSYIDIAKNPVITYGLKKFNRTNKRWEASDQGGQYKPADMLYLAELGYQRFNTKLCRNLIWFANLQRMMRVVLTGHLESLRLEQPVIQGIRIANDKVTEYEGDDTFTEDDYNNSSIDLL